MKNFRKRLDAALEGSNMSLGQIKNKLRIASSTFYPLIKRGGNAHRSSVAMTKLSRWIQDEEDKAQVKPYSSDKHLSLRNRRRGPNHKSLKRTPLQAMRIKAGMTTQEAANRLGCHPATISNMDCGTTKRGPLISRYRAMLVGLLKAKHSGEKQISTLTLAVNIPTAERLVTKRYTLRINEAGAEISRAISLKGLTSILEVLDSNAGDPTF